MTAMTETITVTLAWQETCDCKTTFTLPAETIEQIRESGLDQARQPRPYPAMAHRW